MVIGVKMFESEAFSMGGWRYQENCAYTIRASKVCVGVIVWENEDEN